MIKITKIAGYRFNAERYTFNNKTGKWYPSSKIEYSGPMSLELFLDRQNVDLFFSRAAVWALLNMDRSVAVFNSKGELKILL